MGKSMRKISAIKMRAQHEGTSVHEEKTRWGSAHKERGLEVVETACGRTKEGEYPWKSTTGAKKGHVEATERRSRTLLPVEKEEVTPTKINQYGQ